MWFWIALAVICILLCTGVFRGYNHNYRTGSGLFKNSDNNLEEKDDFVDKEYYDKDGIKK